MNNYFYFDIETIPTQDPNAADRLAEKITAPSNYKDEEKIAAYIQEKAQEAVGKTSFDGFEGHACAIAWDCGDDDRVVSVRDIADERDAIAEFFDALNGYHSQTLVGHNIAGFDIPFLTRRALVLGVRLPQQWPRNIKPWSDKVHDTMVMAGGREYVSLDTMCRALGIPGKDGFDGSQVAAAWAAGEHDKIAEYCADDVSRVRDIHQRFIAIDWCAA